jgi:hypothetical protein
MPSLHFGWALMVAIGLIAATRSRLRWLWLAHPLLTLLVIVGTANHYWLDSLVAAALLALALAVLRPPLRTTAPVPTRQVSATGAAAPVQDPGAVRPAGAPAEPHELVEAGR